MGRPSALAQRNIADDIIHAAEACLAKEPPSKVSLKDIALMAGTNQAMVAYYFGNKDGLWIEILGRRLHEIKVGIERFRCALHDNAITDPTRETITFMVDAFYARPVIGQILCNELPHKESPIRAYYRDNWSSDFCRLVTDVVQYAIDRGQYRSDLRVSRVVEMIRALVFFPMVEQPYTELFGNESRFRADNEWVDSICALLDSYLRPCAARPGATHQPAPGHSFIVTP
jgi:TetR/AcrR family transcriptional regulator